jgi:lipopolysaccharide/colanic/teichoic acid biosynthesis glycosyltransferase
MKRFLDVVLSFLALMVLAPFLLPVVAILRFTGEGEIFYIQERVGRGGNSFGLYKFATMLKNSPNIGAGEITVQGDSRVLPFGKLLRKTKLNELPQLWNIFIGDMSIVGPRPMVPSTFAH